MAVTIAVESPLQDDVRALIAELNAHLLTLTPPEYCSHLTVEQMADDATTVFVAREDHRAVACGALRSHGDGVGEVKRMYTLPSHQGRGIGGRILERIEALAQDGGLELLVLETGHRHEPAWHVYERAGFTRCGPVLDYPVSAYSVFYEKALAAPAHEATATRVPDPLRHGGSMEREVVSGPGLPAQIGPYSQAVRAGGFLFVSGQPGVDPETGESAGPTFGEQARQAFANLDAVLRAGGSSPELVVSTTVLVADQSSFPELNELYGAFFPSEPPARMTLQVPLPRGLLISIGCTAVTAG